jgi:hypothetical protein
MLASGAVAIYEVRSTSAGPVPPGYVAYRRRLWRYWLPDRRPLLAWIMLNPSTADGALDDATIRVCCGRARRLGYGGKLSRGARAHAAMAPPYA